MIQEQTITDHIIETVSRSPGCLLEELAFECPGLTWNQVFLTVDQLSRAGRVRLAKKGPGVYVVTAHVTSKSRANIHIWEVRSCMH